MLARQGARWAKPSLGHHFRRPKVINGRRSLDSSRQIGRWLGGNGTATWVWAALFDQGGTNGGEGESEC